MHKNSRFSGRFAHEGRSANMSRFYDTQVEPIFETTEGKMPLSEFRERFNNSDSKTQFSMAKIKQDGSLFSRKSCVCGGHITIQSDDKAVCDRCKTVFNDGGNIEGLLIVTRHYSDGRPNEVVMPKIKPPPNKKTWLPNDFWKATKNGHPG